jgi:hypothetical protein
MMVRMYTHNIDPPAVGNPHTSWTYARVRYYTPKNKNILDVYTYYSGFPLEASAVGYTRNKINRIISSTQMIVQFWDLYIITMIIDIIGVLYTERDSVHNIINSIFLTV